MGGLFTFQPAAQRLGTLALGIVVYATASWSVWDYWFTIHPTDVARLTYGSNPFDISPEVAEYIQLRTTESDKIAILGSEPQICFYARRRSVTPHIYMYPLFEPQPLAWQMQQEVMADIEAAHPIFLVQVNMDSSWGRRKDSVAEILDWANAYVSTHYDLVGVADLFHDAPANVHWAEHSRNYRPSSENWIAIYRRKPQRLRITETTN